MREDGRLPPLRLGERLAGCEQGVTASAQVAGRRVYAQQVGEGGYEIVSAYDLVPTLADLLSIDPPSGNLCGRSYALLATGKPLPKTQRWQSTVFAHLGNTWMAR